MFLTQEADRDEGEEKMTEEDESEDGKPVILNNLSKLAQYLSLI